MPRLGDLPRVFVLVLLLAALSACQYMPVREPGTDEPEIDVAPHHGPAEASELDQALELLQEGDAEHAEALLEQILAERPADSIARLLLAQIQQPPEAMLGDQFQQIEVGPGDSLSAIAARHAGNSLLFFSLARLNDIQRPRLLRPGQRLVVPLAAKPVDSLPEAAVPPSSQDHLDSDELVEATDDLIRRGQGLRAYSLLISAAHVGPLDARLSKRLAKLASELAESAWIDDAPQRALQLLEQAAPWLGEHVEQAPFAPGMNKVLFRLSLLEARAQLDAGDHEAARITFIGSPEGESGGPYQAEYDATRSALVDHFHVRALSAWREQKVNQAVSLWQQVLEVDANFAPARIYLERGLRIQQQLENLPPE